MEYPGNNELHLNMATLTKMVEDALNAGRPNGPRIRVTHMAAQHGYFDTLVAKITTDPPKEGEAS